MMQRKPDQGQLAGSEVTNVYAQALELCAPDVRLEKDVQTVERLVAMIQRLGDASACAKYLQGALLNRLREQERWREQYPGMTFAEFCEQATGLRYRAAKYLMDIYAKATHLGLKPERLRNVGWTKTREILCVATKETVEEWITEAQTKTRTQLRDRVQIERSKRMAAKQGVEIPEPLVPLTVRVTVEQRDYIEWCLEEIDKEAQSLQPGRVPSRGDCLELLCTDAIANRLPRDRSLKWLMVQFNRVYGVKLVVAGADAVKAAEVTPT